MSYFENRLALSAKQLGEASAELLEWVDDNEQLVATERVSLLREFYRAGTAAQRLAGAVNTLSCVALVGPRRAGKTQLLSALVERGNGPLVLRFEGIQDSVGLARHIVPESGRLGTSAVLRLSAKSRPTPQNFPIVVRLMPLADLVKTFAGAYFKAAPDRRTLAPGVVAVRRLLDAVGARLGDSPVAGLREDDVWDLRDYLAARHGDEPVLRVLSAAGFWEFLAENCARITAADKSLLLGQIWGGMTAFSAMFAHLADALGRLGHGREASCALDAILGLDQRTGRFVRRPDSIIAAATLTSLMAEGEDAIVVRTELGQWVSLARSALAALVSEIRLPIKGYESELLDKADLIEMPAIEPREAIAAIETAIARDPLLPVHLFMKAKAVVLLERYTADTEITSMVVCIDPASRKLGELPRLVAQWVERTHGSDPAERETNDSGLFIAFTKFDRELTEPVRRAKDRRVDVGARVVGMLVDEFGRDHAWPAEWTPGRSFDAVHLVRNAATKLKNLCDYDSLGRETGFRSGVMERIDRARVEFLASPIVARHVADPVAVWDEALELNDGGISYLAQSIADVCDMRVKHRQVLSSLTQLRQSMKDRLQRYYVSDNPAVQQSRRHGAALAVVRRVRQCVEARRLGPLIHALQLPQAELADVLAKMAEVLGEDVGSASEQEASALARAAVMHWIETMRAVASTGNANRRFKLPHAVLMTLIDELVVGAGRLDLEAAIAARIEAAVAGEPDVDRRVDVAAMCAADAIGAFVMWLGFADSRSNSRPRRKGRHEHSIFPPRPEVDPTLLEDSARAHAEQRFFADWSVAFTTLVAESAANLRERSLDAEQNRRLGQLMILLDTTI